MALPSYKELIHSALGKFGLEIRRLPKGTFRAGTRRHSQELPLFLHALRRLQRHHFSLNTIIDVGASDARWSLGFADVLPGKVHLLLDANPVHTAALQRACRFHPSWQYRIVAVGAENGTAYFDASDPMAGHLSARPASPAYEPCDARSLDTLVREAQVQGPFLIKLDTHGVEIPLLLGARQVLNQTALVVAEVYNFSLGHPAVPFWEFCAFMAGLGFRPLDLYDVLYREVDRAFWQFDLIFARADLPLFDDHRFFCHAPAPIPESPNPASRP
ncbi:MAG TPA: FkbM family methyltransferase [Chthoniobacterales bacterium]